MHVLHKYSWKYILKYIRLAVFKIESTKKRKDLFIKIVLPLVLEENNRIKLDRKRLFVILNKNNNTKSEKRWLKKN